MFIGHFAVGLAAKKFNPSPSLGTYFFAVQLLDLLWPTLLLLNLEKVEINPGSTVLPLNFTSYPISHSLLMVAVWGFLTSIVYWLFTKNKSAAVVTGLCVISHWFLDLIVHVPDLLLYPGNSPLFGFGLWKSPVITLILEIGMFIGGVLLYVKATAAKNKKGSIGFWSLVIFLMVVHILSAFSPPPPHVDAVAWAGQLQWIIVIWAYWVDINRQTNRKQISVDQGNTAVV